MTPEEFQEKMNRRDLLASVVTLPAISPLPVEAGPSLSEWVVRYQLRDETVICECPIPADGFHSLPSTFFYGGWLYGCLGGGDVDGDEPRVLKVTCWKCPAGPDGPFE